MYKKGEDFFPINLGRAAVEKGARSERPSLESIGS